MSALAFLLGLWLGYAVTVGVFALSRRIDAALQERD
jgi:hypothetical protein